MRKALRPVLWLLLILSLMVQALPALGEGTASTRWADASDEIDKYLDTAFEDYLAGDAGTAYSNVNDAYFRVYETTGFERQTMSYVSGNLPSQVCWINACLACAVSSKSASAFLRKPEIRSGMSDLRSLSAGR